MKQGVDFSGGRNYVVRFAEKVNTDDIINHLEDGFVDAQVSVITIGTEDQVRITTNYKIADNSETIDDEVEEILFNELQPELEQYGVTKEMFLKGYLLEDGKAVLASVDAENTLGVQSSQKVGPAIADDIKADAIWAIVFSMIGIFIYIFVRFRNVSYSVGSVASLLHDVVFILGLYSLLYSIMPFSLEIDQSFIAAILTIIGYSMNDTVVVFDRVRENVGLYPKQDFFTTINKSINSTLGRTVMTSGTTLLVLLVIFILGAESIRSFVFAMLVGVIVGTLATIYIASPVAYLTDSRRKAKKAALK